MKRVLFFAEAVTLAHVGRPAALAQSLNAERYEVTIACSPRYQHFLTGVRARVLPLDSISSARFLSALARGSPVYDIGTLRRYVREDLEIIGATAPDLVVGDFRLSLSVSCRLAGVRYGAITNAYWSPYGVDATAPLPVLPLTRALPIPVAQALFRIAQPFAFALHCRPLNQVRREYGFPALGNDLRRLYTDADHTLYADLPGFFDLSPLPGTHRYLGPVLWSPPAQRPAWWDSLPADKAIVYMTLGSSGNPRVVEQVTEALAGLPITAMISTAGGPKLQHGGGNLYSAAYLPGLEAAARADLVICNGGSPTSQQALASSVPVLGIAGNMDQFLNMQGVSRSGAGSLLRADRLDTGLIRQTIETLLGVPDYTSQAKAIGVQFNSIDTQENFRTWVDEATAP